MTQPVDLVGLYAKLSLVADRYYARGQQPPAHITNGINNIITRARASLTPAQMAAAEQHVHIARDRIMREEMTTRQQQHIADTDAKTERAVREMTRGMAGQTEGLTPTQFQAVLQGKPIPNHMRELSQQERDYVFQNRTQHIDPHGRGWTESEWQQHMDHLTDADDAAFQELSKNYRADPTDLRRAANEWGTERITRGIIERRQANDDRPSAYEREPTPFRATEDDERRADVIAAFGEVAVNDRPTLDVLTINEVSRESLEDTSSRGDVARAWVDTESRGAT